jgi:Na+-translocating ferredoxin:NAD+ oxidoreductase RnfG subunit
MKSLIKIAVVLAFAAVGSGNLPKVINQVRKAQFQLIMESKASNWPKAMRMPSR